MLRLIEGAETVLSDIETLYLGRRFPAVVLASNFINDPDPTRRRRALVHAFRSQLLTDEELDADLRAVGLCRRRFLDERGSWIEAVPTTT